MGGFGRRNCCCCANCEFFDDDFTRDDNPSSLGDDWEIIAPTVGILGNMTVATADAAAITVASNLFNSYRVWVYAKGLHPGDQLRLIAGYSNPALYYYLQLEIAYDGCGYVGLYNAADVLLSHRLKIAHALPSVWHYLELNLCEGDYADGGLATVVGFASTNAFDEAGTANGAKQVIAHDQPSPGHRVGIAAGNATALISFENFNWENLSVTTDVECLPCDDETACGTLRDAFVRSIDENPIGDPWEVYTPADWRIDAAVSKAIGDGWLVGNHPTSEEATGQPYRRTVEASLTVGVEGAAALVGTDWYLAPDQTDPLSADRRMFTALELTFATGGGSAQFRIASQGAPDDLVGLVSVPGLEPGVYPHVRLCEIVTPENSVVGAVDVVQTTYVAEIDVEGETVVELTMSVDWRPEYGRSGVGSAIGVEVSLDYLRLCSFPHCPNCWGAIGCVIDADIILDGCKWLELSGDWRQAGTGVDLTSLSGLIVNDTLYNPDMGGIYLAASVVALKADATATIYYAWEDVDNWSAVVLVFGDGTSKVGQAYLSANVAGVVTNEPAFPFAEIRHGPIQTVSVTICAPTSGGGAKAFIFAGGRLLQLGGVGAVGSRVALSGTTPVDGEVQFWTFEMGYHKSDDRPDCPECFNCTIYDGGGSVFREFGGSGLVPRVHPDGETAGTIVGAFQFDSAPAAATLAAGADTLSVIHPTSGLAKWQINGGPLYTTEIAGDGQYDFRMCYGDPSTLVYWGYQELGHTGELRSAPSNGGGATISHAGDGTIAMNLWEYQRCGGCLQCMPHCGFKNEYRFRLEGFRDSICTNCGAFNGTYFARYYDSSFDVGSGVSQCRYRIPQPVDGAWGCAPFTAGYHGIYLIFEARHLESPPEAPVPDWWRVSVAVELSASPAQVAWFLLDGDDFDDFDCFGFGERELPFWRYEGSGPLGGGALCVIDRSTKITLFEN